MSTSHKEVFAFLDEHKLGVLSTASESHDVWGAAIYYVVDKQFNFYFLTHVDSKKYHNIKHHSQVAFTIADDAGQKTVQVAGDISEVPLGDEQNEAYRKLALVHPPGEFSWVPPVSKMHGQTVLLKLKPTTLHFADFKSYEPTFIKVV